MRATFKKYGPAHDYRGAHVVTPDGKIGKIIAVYYREFPPAWMVKLNYLCGEPFPHDFSLAALDILERTYEEEEERHDTLHRQD